MLLVSIESGFAAIWRVSTAGGCARTVANTDYGLWIVGAELLDHGVTLRCSQFRACSPLLCEMVLPMTTPLSLRAHQTQLARVDRPVLTIVFRLARLGNLKFDTYR